MSAVKGLMSELAKRGLEPTWMNTGGGCMAVSVFFGPELPNDALMFRYEILVTARDDNFSHDDYSGAEDDELHGFFAGLYVYDDNGEPHYDECTTLYRSADELVSAADVADRGESFPPGAFPVDLAAEILACADAVQFVVQKVEEAETGRGPGDGPEARRQAMLG